MHKPWFITLEGGEGVGKSTAIAFIQQWLQQRQLATVLTREPGGTPLAEKVRDLLLASDDEVWCHRAELLLVFAARAQHIAKVIQPALARGNIVLSDRFTDATFAYQGFGRGLSTEDIALLERFVQHHGEQKIQPDLTLLLDAPVDVGMARAKKRAALDRFEQEQKAFFERVREGYLSRAQQDPARFIVIDASQALPDVQAQIAKALASRLADDCE